MPARRARGGARRASRSPTAGGSIGSSATRPAPGSTTASTRPEGAHRTPPDPARRADRAVVPAFGRTRVERRLRLSTPTPARLGLATPARPRPRLPPRSAPAARAVRGRRPRGRHAEPLRDGRRGSRSSSRFPSYQIDNLLALVHAGRSAPTGCGAERPQAGDEPLLAPWPCAALALAGRGRGRPGRRPYRRQQRLRRVRHRRRDGPLHASRCGRPPCRRPWPTSSGARGAGDAPEPRPGRSRSSARK